MLTASIKVNFAVHHLRAAVHAARNAYKVEQDNVNAEHGPWFDELLLSVPVVVVMAGAALEASANEIIKDILDGYTNLSLTMDCRLRLAELNERSGNTIDKYWRLAQQFQKKADRGKATWQNAKLLVDFRNSFMHFKPAWDHETDIHDGRLVKSLRSKIPIYRAYQSDFQFPYGFMTYGCAKWSVASVLTFSAGFSALLGVKDRFVYEHLDFSLP